MNDHLAVKSLHPGSAAAAGASSLDEPVAAEAQANRAPLRTVIGGSRVIPWQSAAPPVAPLRP